MLKSFLNRLFGRRPKVHVDVHVELPFTVHMGKNGHPVYRSKDTGKFLKAAECINKEG